MIKKLVKFFYNSRMESYFKIQTSNDDIILTPSEGYDTTLIFMHGLGDSAKGYKDLFTSEYKPIPNRMRVVLLTAPKASVTINGGMIMTSWYDILTFDRSADSVSEDDVIRSAYRVQKVIENEVKRVGGDFKKIFLGGFSQGACMSLHVGLTQKNKLGGLIALSGFLFPFTAKEIDGNYKDLPIFLAHGKYDDLIPESLAKASYKVLPEAKFSNVNYKSYDEGHSIAMDELVDLKNFINKLI